MSYVWSTPQEWPYPPANPTAMSAFIGTDVDIRWDDPATLNTGPSTPSTRAAMVVTVAGSPITLQTATASVNVVAGGITAGETLTIGGEVLAWRVPPLIQTSLTALA
jgi:hypothetical protein